MNNTILWLLGSVAALALVYWASRRCAAWERRAGAQAFRDGLPLNPRWSSYIIEGWTDEWIASRPVRRPRSPAPPIVE